MNKFLIKTCLVATLFATGCAKNFDEVNTDPTQAPEETYDPNLLLSSAEINYISATSGYNGPVLFQSMWTQILASAVFPSYYSGGDKYVQGGSFLDYQQRTWNTAYQAASYCRQIQNLAKGKDNLRNLSGISVIAEVMNIQAITDVYGDCPYSQALQAKTSVTQPAYDKQEDVYNLMLSKLDSVLPTLDPAMPQPTNDVIYKGSVDKWKKFGYSLMLRMAMRLTKVAPDKAKQYAEKAFAGGVFGSNSDNAYIVFDFANGYQNSNAGALSVNQDYSEVRWGRVLIDYLKTSGDPRLGKIAEVPPFGAYMEANKLVDSSTNKAYQGNADPNVQLGMPSGYDQNGGATDIKNAPGYPGPSQASAPNPIGKYSRPKTTLYLGLNTPSFYLTYAQVEFLLAEAAVRGWSVGDGAAAHYRRGLSAALQTYSTLNSVGAINPEIADSYANDHPLDLSSMDASLKQINTQIWVLTGTILDFDEAWSNYRRSGYPVLQPVNYVGNFAQGQIPRRQAYPTSEASTNPVNYKAALTSLGSAGDTYFARMWWDKQ